jgi:hypothetical protein
MKKKHGDKTGLFGAWLTDYLRHRPGCEQTVVYYDHGNKQANPNVAAIKGFYGDRLTRINLLTQADVMVVNPDGQIILIIEIEERASSPKKIIGDVVVNIMCNRYAVVVDGKNCYFVITPETNLIVAGVISMKGAKVAQLEEVIAPQLKRLIASQGGFDERNVKLVFKGDIEATLEALKGEVKDFLEVFQ